MLPLHCVPQHATRKVKLAYDPWAAFTDKHSASFRIMEEYLIKPDMTGHTAGPLAGLKHPPTPSPITPKRAQNKQATDLQQLSPTTSRTAIEPPSIPGQITWTWPPLTSSQRASLHACMMYYCDAPIIAELFRNQLPVCRLDIHEMINLLEQMWEEACKRHSVFS